MFDKILVPVDVNNKHASIDIIKSANQIAQDRGSGRAQLRLITVLPDFGMPLVASFFPQGAQDSLRKELKTILEKLAEEYVTVEVSIALRQGKRAREILAEAEEWMPDLIVIGERNKDQPGGHTLGSCSGSVADRAKCAVLIVR